MNTLLSLLLLYASAGLDMQPSIMPQFLPAAPAPRVAAIFGNSRMTAGVSPAGVITELHWPSPGYYDQLQRNPWAAAQNPAALQGLVWGFRLADGPVLWLDHALLSAQSTNLEDGVITQRLTVAEGATVDLRCFIHQEYPLLFSEITLRTAQDQTPAFFWYGGFAAATRLVPQLPLANSLFEGRQPQVAYGDLAAQRVYHVAPAQTDHETVEEIRTLAHSEAAPAAWKGIEGTILGYESATGMLDFTCQSAAPETRESPESVLGGAGAAAMATGSLAAISPEQVGSGWRAAVVVAAGKSAGEVGRLLDHAHGRNWDDLAQAVQSVTRAKQVLVPGALMSDPQVFRAALLLRICTDSISNAIVRAPISTPPMDLDEPRVGVWLSHAMDLLGWHEQAQAHLAFYARAVRTEATESRPFGSLPAALYTDGMEASPPFLLATDAPAWFLSACWRHGKFLDAGERRDFFSAMEEPMSRCMDFLARWTLSPQKVALASFDGAVLRETRDMHWLLLAYMGLDSGLQALRLVDRPLSESWTGRHRELQAALRFQVLNADGIVSTSQMLPYWLREILPPEDRVWDLRLTTPGGLVPFREVAFPGSEWTDDSRPWPDALQAAYYIIGAAQTVAEAPRAEP